MLLPLAWECFEGSGGARTREDPEGPSGKTSQYFTLEPAQVQHAEGRPNSGIPLLISNSFAHPFTPKEPSQGHTASKQQRWIRNPGKLASEPTRGTPIKPWASQGELGGCGGPPVPGRQVCGKGGSSPGRAEGPDCRVWKVKDSPFLPAIKSPRSGTQEVPNNCVWGFFPQPVFIHAAWGK